MIPSISACFLRAPRPPPSTRGWSAPSPRARGGSPCRNLASKRVALFVQHGASRSAAAALVSSDVASRRRASAAFAAARAAPRPRLEPRLEPHRAAPLAHRTQGPRREAPGGFDFDVIGEDGDCAGGREGEGVGSGSCAGGDRRGGSGSARARAPVPSRGSAARGGDEAVNSPPPPPRPLLRRALTHRGRSVALARGSAHPSRPNGLSPCCPSSLFAAASAFNPASTVDSMSFAILDACSAA